MLLMDGVYYNVRVVYNSMNRSFELAQGPNQGQMLSTRFERDLLGTSYSYSMQIEPVPGAYADYDAFYEAISAPVDSHSITLPYAQGNITFDAMILSGTDLYRGKLAGQRWGNLMVEFVPIEVQRT